MPTSLKNIRNTTAVKQFAFVGGKQFVLEPDEEKLVVEELAGEFLSQNPGAVEIVEERVAPGAAVQDANARKATIWVANMTGNPDASATIKMRVKTKVGYQIEEVVNPHAAPMTIRGEMDGGMVEYTDSQIGLLAENLGKIPVAVPPYTRRELPRNLGQWLLNRDSNGRFQTPNAAGRLIESRAPSSFEPTMDWDLDDMRCYLRMMDDSAELGPKQSEVLASAKGEQDYATKLLAAKTLCMRRLHFRLAQPASRLYTKTEFEGFRHAFEKPEKPLPKSAPVAAGATA